jgi:ankyrin repeat protein
MTYCCVNIHEAVIHEHIDCVQELIAQVNDIDCHGLSPVFYANIECMNFLIENGANIDQQDPYGYTTLKRSIKNIDIFPQFRQNTLNRIEFLLKHGASTEKIITRDPDILNLIEKYSPPEIKEPEEH